MYEDGVGVAQNALEAAAWYRKAAGQGDADAQNRLGGMYEVGRGVKQDLLISYALFYLAARDGFDTAVKGRERVSELLSKGQQKEAQALSRSWQAGEPLPIP